MIDIEKAKKEFIEHVNKVKVDNPRVQRKISHTFRVMENCRKIANKLKLSEEEIKLAQLIGLLHDIGRFEQYRIYSKYTDVGTLDKNIKFDHGKEGVEILKKDNYIRKYIEEEKYDNIIFNAIDIIYEGVYIYWKEDMLKEVEEGKLSKTIVKDFYMSKLANKENKISEADSILSCCSFIYDINFKYSFEILKENDNISKMIDRFNYKIPETKLEMMKVKEIAKKYIIEKAK